MKVTKSYIKRIIKEELTQVLDEVMNDQIFKVVSERGVAGVVLPRQPFLVVASVGKGGMYLIKLPGLKFLGRGEIEASHEQGATFSARDVQDAVSILNRSKKRMEDPNRKALFELVKQLGSEARTSGIRQGGNRATYSKLNEDLGFSESEYIVEVDEQLAAKLEQEVPGASELFKMNKSDRDMIRGEV